MSAHRSLLGKSVQHMLNVSSSHSDPQRTSAPLTRCKNAQPARRLFLIRPWPARHRVQFDHLRRREFITLLGRRSGMAALRRGRGRRCRRLDYSPRHRLTTRAFLGRVPGRASTRPVSSMAAMSQSNIVGRMVATIGCRRSHGSRHFTPGRPCWRRCPIWLA